MVVLVGIGAIALNNVQTLTTPAQTPIVAPSCPDGYKQLDSTTATSPADATTLCPGGDVIIFEGPTTSTVRTNTGTTIGGTTDGGIGSTADSSIVGSGDGDASRTSSTPSRIVCCRPPDNSPTASPIPTATPIPVITEPKNDTPKVCVIPELDIQKVVLECPNCDAK